MFSSRQSSVFACGRVLFLSLVLIAAATAPAQTVIKAKWRSSSPNAKWTPEAALQISNYSAQPTEIVLDSSVKYQTMTAWGGSPNEVGMVALHKLSAADQEAVIKAFYDTVDGCKFNMIRLPIGSSDFSLTGYSLDDFDGDYTMSKITIDREKPMALEFIKNAMKYNTGLKVWGSPWSAPAWMKKNKNWFGGNPVPATDCELNQDTATFRAYALYFSKAVTLYKDFGIPFFALSFQNEPYTCQTFPSMIWPTGEKMRDFMKNYLGPRMQADHPDIELWTPTMNLSDTNMYVPMLRDAYTKSLITTCGFQYQGKDVIAAIHSKFPNLRLYSTELVCGGGDNLWDYAFSTTFTDLKYYIANGASGAFQWNLFLEKQGKAGYNWNWNQNSMITIDTVAKTYTMQSQYYVLKHFSYYIRPGSRLIGATGNYAANAVAVVNPDKSLAVVAQNRNNSNQSITVRFGNQMITATMPASSFASFLVYDSVTSSVLNPNFKAFPEERFVSVNKFFKISGDKFLFPAEFKGRTCSGAIYDISGRFVREFSAKNGTMSLSKDFGVSKGVYVVHIKAVHI
jgi:glucosylceramidase